MSPTRTFVAVAPGVVVQDPVKVSMQAWRR